jgi:hypothetical protein
MSSIITGSNLPRFRIFVLVAATALAACENEPKILEPEAVWTDLPCVDQNDCGEAFFGDVCNVGCPNGTVHKEYASEYSARLNELQESCWFLERQDDGSSECTGTIDCFEARCRFVAGE